MSPSDTATSLLSGHRVQSGGRSLGFSSYFLHRDLNLEKEVTAIAQGNILLRNTLFAFFIFFFPVDAVPLYIKY